MDDAELVVLAGEAMGALAEWTFVSEPVRNSSATSPNKKRNKR